MSGNILPSSRIVFLDGHTLWKSANVFEPFRQLGEFIVYDRTPPELVYERAEPADIVLTNKTALDAQMLVRLKQLKFIAVTATGFNVVDVAAAGARSIPVSNVPEYGTNAVAQHTIALMLELANRVGIHNLSVHQGEWSRSPDWSYTVAPLMELDGKTLGIIGFGRIGKRVAQIAAALGMHVLVCSRKSAADLHANFRTASLDEVCSQSDVITLHCPLTDATRGMINASLLQRMKPSALLINCSRGQLVIEQDLADALNDGTIAGAAIDVVSEEPIRESNALLSAKNCIITPHIAWAATEAKQRVIQTTAQNIANFLAGSPINVVNAAHLMRHV